MVIVVILKHKRDNGTIRNRRVVMINTSVLAIIIPVILKMILDYGDITTNIILKTKSRLYRQNFGIGVWLHGG